MVNIAIDKINEYDLSSYGTQIKGVASSSDGIKLYAAVYGYGIVRSTNSGTNWNPTTLIQNQMWTSISCSYDGSIIYAAALGNGLYKSINSGHTWNMIPNQSLPGGNDNPEITMPGGPYDMQNVNCIACDGTGSKLIMTTNGVKVIYTSINGGTSWIMSYIIPNTNQQNGPVTVSSNQDGSILYVAFNMTDKKIYKSIDSGTTWNVINTMGDIIGEFNTLSSNLFGDFLYASNADNVFIFYENHNNKGLLTAPGGSIFTAISSYNNGNNILVSLNNGKVQTYLVHNIYSPGSIESNTNKVACFKNDTQILCFKENLEQYINIQDIRKGDLIKTSRNGYVAVNMIGTTKLYNSGNDLRSPNKLYKCSPLNYPELTQDLFITGCHSILVDHLTEYQREKTKEILNDIYVTDSKYRLIACLDERSIPYEEEGLFDIYHLALENDDYYMNYGIYANGLLVETSSKRYLKEVSGMTLIE